MSEQHLDEVRRFVRDVLQEAPAFGELPSEERRKLASAMVRVLGFLMDPTAGQPQLAPHAASLADDNSADAVDQLKQRLASKPKLVGKDFKAGAAREGAEVFKTMVDSVDFTRFVSGLIDGVFTSIVSSSIQQMREYAKLLEAVVMSVSEFAQNNISDGQARQYLVDSFPKQLTVDQGDAASNPALKLKEDADPPDFKSFLGSSDDYNVDDEESEKKLVGAAQLKMARMRQQELATMVVLGINRIIVTEGEIKASVLFDVKATDDAKRSSNANMDDSASRSLGFWDDGFSYTDMRVTTAHADTSEDSDAKLAAKANLSGSVTVKFKSETFPLERMASSMDLATVQQRSQKGPAT